MLPSRRCVCNDLRSRPLSRVAATRSDNHSAGRTDTSGSHAIDRKDTGLPTTRRSVEMIERLGRRSMQTINLPVGLSFLRAFGSCVQLLPPLPW